MYEYAQSLCIFCYHWFFFFNYNFYITLTSAYNNESLRFIRYGELCALIFAYSVKHLGNAYIFDVCDEVTFMIIYV